jgi:hypothetical protein
MMLSLGAAKYVYTCISESTNLSTQLKLEASGIPGVWIIASISYSGNREATI